MSKGGNRRAPKKGSSGMDDVSIDIKKLEIQLDPTVEIFAVDINSADERWRETIPSEEALRMFLRGVQAGASMWAKRYVAIPEIPQSSLPFPLKFD